MKRFLQLLRTLASKRSPHSPGRFQTGTVSVQAGGSGVAAKGWKQSRKGLKTLFATLLCLGLMVGLMPGMDTTAFAASQHGIGDTVWFAGHEWYIIGTETEGVKAPAGSYTLFAKNNDFGETVFGDNFNYNGSILQSAVEQIANSFSESDKNYIVPRNTLDDVVGDSPTNQLLWPISRNEWNSIEDTAIQKFEASYYTRTGGYEMQGTSGNGKDVIYYIDSSYSNPLRVTPNPSKTSAYIRPALYVKAEGIPENITGIQVAFGGQWWYVVGQGVNGSVPGPENTVTLFENPSAPPRPGVATATEYMGSDLQEAMAGFGSNLTLAGKESSLIVPRTLTTADEITGSTAADQPFWPLSKSEAERIGNTDILKADIDPLACYWLRTSEGTYNYVYAVDRSTGTVIGERSNGVYGVRPAFYLDISDAFYLAKDAKRVTIGGNPYPLVLEGYEEYKYTIFDDSLKLSVTADPTQASQTGNTLSFGYVATIGEKTYLACVLTADGDNNVLYYNTLADLTEASAASGTVNIPLTGVADGDYTLRLYTEQQNGNNTDFASPTTDVKITVKNGAASIRGLGNVQLVGDSGDQGGQDGREVELRATDTHIQWRYVGEDDDAWRDLVALDAITGGDGADGREVELQAANGYIQWRYATGADTAWKNLMPLSDLKGDSGADGREVELKNDGTNILWRYKGEGDDAWQTLVALSDIAGSDGADGKQVELRVDGGYIQWKYDTDGDWQNLIALSALQGIKGDKGDPGEDGDTPYIGDNGNWWIGTTDTGIPATGDSGSDGADGEDGEDGEDGLTPYIGDNGNWWIGTTDTGVKASGSNGKDGSDGEDGKDGLTPYIGGNGNWWIGGSDTGVKASGSNGKDGKDGLTSYIGGNQWFGGLGTGINAGGTGGSDGVGIANIKLNEDGELIITLTNGTEQNLGKVKGEDGVGVSDVSINEDGELIIALTNGTESNAGVVRTAETAASTGDTEISRLKTLVYVSVGTAGVSLAGLIAMLAFLLAKRKS